MTLRVLLAALPTRGLLCLLLLLLLIPPLLRDQLVALPRFPLCGRLARHEHLVL